MILEPPRDDDPDRSYPPDEGALREFYKSREWQRLAYEVKLEFGRQCQCCGAHAAQGVRIVSDHIRPARYYWHLRLTKTNVQVLCEECNLGKGSWDETDFQAMAEMGRAAKRTIDRLGYGADSRTPEQDGELKCAIIDAHIAGLLDEYMTGHLIQYWGLTHA